MKSVLFVHDQLDFRAGGAVLVVHSLLASMDRTRFSLELATPRPRGAEAVPEEFRELELPIHRLPPLMQTSERSVFRIIATVIELLMINIELLSLMIQRKPDFLYVHSVTSLHFATLPALLTRTPLVYHEHGLKSLRTESLWDGALPWLIKRATHVICIAQIVAEDVIGGGIDPARVTTVHNGIPESDFEPRLPDATPLPPGTDLRFSLIQIANLFPWKGHATVIRAAGLARKTISNLRVCLYGRTDATEFERELRSLAKSCGADDVVEFCGFHEDLEAKLPEFDGLVVASDSEPFGLVLLEAMRAGVPALGTRAGGVPEIIRHEHDGLLFGPGDHEALAAHLVRLASDRPFARRLAEEGLRTVHARFSLASQARGVEAVFDHLA